jgi:sugar lactone lactonase YvrE
MVSSCAFGGPDYKTMIVTTALNGMENPKFEGGVALITFYDKTQGFAPGIANI